MFKFLKTQSRSILGIDISSSSVKILQISSSNSRYKLEGYGSMDLDENTLEANVVKDVDKVSAVIGKILALENFSSREAAIAVPDSTAISKVIQLNEGLREAEIEEIVMMEADKYIPYPIDEVNLDFEILGPSAKNTAMLDVLIVASRSENVNNRLEAIRKAGLEPKIVDVESYAIERCAGLLAAQLPAAGENKIVAIIDVGEIFTSFYFMHGLKIVFAREEEFGGKQLVDNAVLRYSMKREDVLYAMDKNALPSDYKTEILAPFVESILLQVKRGLQFFFSNSKHTYIDYILLSGGVAKIPGLALILQEHISIPTAVANPFRDMIIASGVDKDRLEQDSPRLLLACGLALRTS